jgi:hypothetical protein
MRAAEFESVTGEGTNHTGAGDAMRGGGPAYEVRALRSREPHSNPHTRKHTRKRKKRYPHHVFLFESEKRKKA